MDKIGGDSFKQEQLSVMDFFLLKKVSITLGIITKDIDKDQEIIKKIKQGYQKGFFEPAIYGWQFKDFSNVTEPEQMVSMYESNQNLSRILGIRASVFIPQGIFNNSTLEALTQNGLRVISGKENFEIANERILQLVSNTTARDNISKIYNMPQTVFFSDYANASLYRQPIEKIMQNISSNIEKYGYAIITFYPEDFAKSPNKYSEQSTNTTQLKKLSDIIDEIHSYGLKIANFSSVTNLGDSKFYEFRTPNPILNDPHLKAEIVYDGLNFPSKFAFLDPNDILVLEKNDGIVKRIVNGTLKDNVIDLNVSTLGERGLLGIAVFHRNSLPPYVFLYYTKGSYDGSDVKSEDIGVENQLYRYELIDDKLQHGKLLFRLPVKSTYNHNGGAMTIGPDNNLYLVIGDQVVSDTKAQNVINGSDPQGNGGILRFSVDGHPVGDGVLGNKYPINFYYAYGIRNSFGVTFDPVTGNLWDTENGQVGQDELNLVKEGFNSGWKQIQGFANQNNSFKENSSNSANGESINLVDFQGRGKYREPEIVWLFPVGPTGISFLNSSKIGLKYESGLFVGEFHHGYLYHFNLTSDREHIAFGPSIKSKNLGSRVSNSLLLGKGFGGIVDIKEGPDGYLYVLATHAGDSNCYGLPRHCVPYESPVGGTIFRIRSSEIHN